MPSAAPQTNALAFALHVQQRQDRGLQQRASRADDAFSTLLDDTAAPQEKVERPNSRKGASKSRSNESHANEPRSKHSRSSDRAAAVETSKRNNIAADKAANQAAQAEPAGQGTQTKESSQDAVAEADRIEPVDAPADAETPAPQDVTATEPAIATTDVTLANVAVVVPTPPSPVATVATLTAGQESAAEGTVEDIAAQSAAAAAAATAAGGKAKPAINAGPDETKDPGGAAAAPTTPAASTAPTGSTANKPPQAATGDSQATAQQSGTTGSTVDDVAPAATSAGQAAPTETAPQRKIAETTLSVDKPAPSPDGRPIQTQTIATPTGLEHFQAGAAASQAAFVTATASTAQTTARQASATSSIPIAGVAIEIAARAQSGANRFEIRLDPPELGRIDVRLDIDRHGNVRSHLVVERSETLDLMRRDAPQLERALQDAGLKTGDGALQFSLRDQGSSGQQNARERLANTATVIVPDADAPPLDAGRNYRRSAGTGGIDIRV